MLELTKAVLEFLFFAGVILAAVLLLAETILHQLRRVMNQLREMRHGKE